MKPIGLNWIGFTAKSEFQILNGTYLIWRKHTADICMNRPRIKMRKNTERLGISKIVCDTYQEKESSKGQDERERTGEISVLQDSRVRFPEWIQHGQSLQSTNIK